MATQITNYQCPSCTGPLHFSPESGKLECEYCCSGFTVAEVEAYFEEKNRQAQEAAAAAQAAPEASEEGWGEDAARMRAYSCPSCGAELICDETTAATACPYCGNPAVVPGQFSDTKKPDYVIPFKLEKDGAVEALKKHYKGKLLLPKAFASENHLQEVKGVYVPFWLYDGRASANVTFEATRSHTRTTPSERITTTEHYKVGRSGNVSFRQVPVDASTKMPDEHMDAIEPYDYGELKPFVQAYLPGFLADKYDVDEGECARRAEERFRNSAIDAMKESVNGFDTVSVRQADVNMKREAAEYALLPVWLLSTRWKEKNFLFAVNGQTGKVAGNLPVSGWKTAFWFVGLFALLTFLGSLMFEIEAALIGGAVIAAIICFLLVGSMNNAVKKTEADSYIPSSGVEITGRYEHFSHRTVTRQKRETNSSKK